MPSKRWDCLKAVIKMNKLEQLINELCPNGVEYKTIQSFSQLLKGMSGVSNKWSNDGNCRFIEYKNAYDNLKIDVTRLPFATVKKIDNQIELKQGDILFTSASETPDECAISSVIEDEIAEGIFMDDHLFGIRVNDKTRYNSTFLNYYFRSDSFRRIVNKTVRGVTRYYISIPNFMKLQIPIPPLPVQEEIVRILDKFTELTAELTAELTVRKQQYEYYRDNLFVFSDNVLYKPLQEIADIGTGSSNTNEELEIGEYPFFVRSQEVRRKDSYEFDEIAIITSGDGVGVGKIFHYIEGKYALHQRAYRIHINTDDVIPKYYFYYMKSAFLSYIEKNSFHSSVTSIRRPMLNNFPVPIPYPEDKEKSLAEQQHIVDILDRFDKLCNDISEGLPAEIEARQKQYEYYRDKLLTFKKKEATENE